MPITHRHIRGTDSVQRLISGAYCYVRKHPIWRFGDTWLTSSAAYKRGFLPTCHNGRSEFTSRDHYRWATSQGGTGVRFTPSLRSDFRLTETLELHRTFTPIHVKPHSYRRSSPCSFPPVLEMPTTFSLESTPDKHAAPDTIVSSDELETTHMEDGATVDDAKVPPLSSGIDNLDQNATEASATPVSQSGMPPFPPSLILCGIPIVPTFPTLILQPANV